MAQAFRRGNNTEVPKRLVVVGAGGHGRETLDVAERAGFEVIGVVSADQPEDTLLARRGSRWLGGIDALITLGGRGGADFGSVSYVLGIGDPAIRQRLDGELASASIPAATLVHPWANLGADVYLDDGVILAAGSHVTTNVVLGRHTHLNIGAIVSHDCRIGNWVSLSPGVAVNGNVTIGDGVFLGTGSVVTPGCTIGEGAVIGAGAVVTGDVPAGVTAVGTPARW
jgi:sugar O-acyltransferase (sialic acid O-acetyltransferase NeuD family)